MIPTMHWVNPIAAGAVAGGGGGLGFPHLYWRITDVNNDTAQAYVELSELLLFEDGVDVTSGVVTPTASNAVSFGSLAALTDGNLSNRAQWDNTAPDNWNHSGFYIQYLFPVPRKINGVKQGQFDDANLNLGSFTLRYSDDGVAFYVLGSKTGLGNPGNFTLSSLISF